MNLLTKWNPIHKGDELNVWRPTARWDPLREMEDMMRGMQRVFTTWPAKSEESMTLSEWRPSVDIGENDKEYVVKAELPDVNKEDIKVSVEGGTLSISGERRVEKEEQDMKFHRMERAYGHFERTFSLPDEADTDQITSEYKQGILTVHLPKNPGVKPAAHQIPVN
jgi:HSP20 family protein